jgi:hypothetical protein
MHGRVISGVEYKHGYHVPVLSQKTISATNIPHISYPDHVKKAHVFASFLYATNQYLLYQAIEDRENPTALEALKTHLLDTVEFRATESESKKDVFKQILNDFIINQMMNALLIIPDIENFKNRISDRAFLEDHENPFSVRLFAYINQKELDLRIINFPQITDREIDRAKFELGFHRSDPLIEDRNLLTIELWKIASLDSNALYSEKALNKLVEWTLREIFFFPSSLDEIMCCTTLDTTMRYTTLRKMIPDRAISFAEDPKFYQEILRAPKPIESLFFSLKKEKMQEVLMLSLTQDHFLDKLYSKISNKIFIDEQI